MAQFSGGDVRSIHNIHAGEYSPPGGGGFMLNIAPPISVQIANSTWSNHGDRWKVITEFMNCMVNEYTKVAKQGQRLAKRTELALLQFMKCHRTSDTKRVRQELGSRLKKTLKKSFEKTRRNALKDQIGTALNQGKVPRLTAVMALLDI